MDFDKVLESVGPFGKYQLHHYLLLGFGGVTTGMNNMANVFLAASPEYSCDTTSLPALHNNKFMSAIRPPTGDVHCTVYDVNHTELLVSNAWGEGNVTEVWVDNDTSTVDCSRWSYDHDTFGETIVTKWDLVCNEAWRTSLASSVYMLGFLLGVIGFGSIADRIGRKPTWLISSALMVVSGIVAAFMPNYWAHIFIRLLSACGSAGSYTTGFVLSMEQIGGVHRMVLGICYQAFFAFGYMILPMIAYYIKDYRYLIITICLIQSVFVINIWLISESPRWLLTQGRIKECQEGLRLAARMNGRAYPEHLVELEAEHLSQQLETTHERKEHTVLDLLRTPNMRKNSLNIFYNWFVNSFVYYGLSLGVSNLVGSIYWNLFMSALVEFPSFIIAAVLLHRVGRRWPLAILMAGGGICCLGTLLVPAHLGIVTTVLAMLGKLGISGSFCIIYVFSAELFPTVVRATGVGAGSMHARVGGLVAPFVADLGKLVWEPLPFIIFGFCSLLGGGLALLLPETRDMTLPETIEDGEHFGKKEVEIHPKSPFDNSKDDTVKVAP